MHEGLKALNVKLNSVTELNDWFNRCHEAGVASSICRPAIEGSDGEEGMEAQISLKVDLPALMTLAKREHASEHASSSSGRTPRQQW